VLLALGRIWRGLRFTLKWLLVAAGAWMLVMLYVQRYGKATAAWLLIFPFAWGIYQHLSGRARPQ
jgi:hypothetical protein